MQSGPKIAMNFVHYSREFVITVIIITELDCRHFATWECPNTVEAAKCVFFVPDYKKWQHKLNDNNNWWFLFSNL
jgi:hypothetical protein